MEVETREGEGGGCGPVGIDNSDPDERVEMLEPEDRMGGTSTVSQEGTTATLLGVCDRSLGMFGNLTVPVFHLVYKGS